MPHAALWVVQLKQSEDSVSLFVGFNAARGFVGGAAEENEELREVACCFNAARGFVGGAAHQIVILFENRDKVSMPHAALWVVQQL